MICESCKKVKFEDETYEIRVDEDGISIITKNKKLCSYEHFFNKEASFKILEKAVKAAKKRYK